MKAEHITECYHILTERHPRRNNAFRGLSVDSTVSTKTERLNCNCG